MEDQYTQPNKPIVETMPTQPYTFKDGIRNHKKLLLIIGGVLLVIAIALVAWLFIRSHAKKTPEQILQSLAQSSEKVGPSPTERANTLQDSAAKSHPVKATNEDRINMLNALK